MASEDLYQQFLDKLESLKKRNIEISKKAKAKGLYPCFSEGADYMEPCSREDAEQYSYRLKNGGTWSGWYKTTDRMLVILYENPNWEYKYRKRLGVR